MDPTTQKKLRSLLVPGAGLLIPGAADAIAGRIIEAAGFDAMMLTGAGFANSYLGVPDLGLTTATEVAQNLGAVRDAVGIPIVVDADTGFGNALNVYRTVRMFERAGADAIQLEDQVFPKRCGHFEGKQVVAVEEMVQKIRAATDARQGELMILARTDARAVEGLERALERARAYLDAGADMLFIEAPQSAGELAAIPRSLPAVHVCNMVFGGKTPLFSQRELAEFGYAGVLYANAALQASMLAMQRVMDHLRRNGSLEGVEASVISFEQRQKLVDYPRYQELEARYRVESVPGRE